jgi:phosphohistidine phosphatase
VEPRIYEASVATLLSVIAQQDQDADVLMMVGHNPGFTDICNELGDQRIENVSTCGIVAISFQCDTWKEVTSMKGKTDYCHFPKEFKKQDQDL